MSEEFNCGSAISTACKGKTIPLGETGFKLFMSELTSILTIAVNLGLSMLAGEMTTNQLNILRSVRCILVGGLDSGWNFLAALYYAAKEFDQVAELQKYVDEYYPYVCTCSEEVNKIQKQFSGKKDGEKSNTDSLAFCDDLSA